MMHTLQLEIINQIAVLSLNRPSKRNAMNSTFWTEFHSTFTSTLNSDILAVIITSTSQHFTSGLDISDFNLIQSGDPARSALKFYEVVKKLQNTFTAIEDFKKPVIVCIEGYCIGGGIDLITSCDIRLCTSSAKFSVKEVDIALAADLGTLQRLPKIVGNQSWVRDVCFTGRIFDSSEAYQQGLVSRVYESRDEMMQEAMKLAVLIGSKSQVAVVGIKNVLNYSRDHGVVDGLNYVGVWNSAMVNTEDIKTAVASKRPTFSKL